MTWAALKPNGSVWTWSRRTPADGCPAQGARVALDGVVEDAAEPVGVAVRRRVESAPATAAAGACASGGAGASHRKVDVGIGDVVEIVGEDVCDDVRDSLDDIRLG